MNGQSVLGAQEEDAEEGRERRWFPEKVESYFQRQSCQI